MTYSGQDLLLVHVERIRHPLTQKDPCRKDGSEGIQILSKYWMSKLRITCITLEVQIKIDSMKNDESQSWIDEKVAASTEKHLCDKTKGTSHTIIFFLHP